MRSSELENQVVVARLNTNSKVNPYVIGRALTVENNRIIFEDLFNLMFSPEGDRFELIVFNALQDKDDNVSDIPMSMVISVGIPDEQFVDAYRRRTTGIQVANVGDVPTSSKS